MLTRLKREPLLISAFLTLLGVVLGIYLKNPELVAALVGVVAAMLGIRQTVTPVGKVPEIATEVATKTVEQLSSHTVGKVGEITDGAKEVIDQTVGKILFPGRVPYVKE